MGRSQRKEAGSLNGFGFLGNEGEGRTRKVEVQRIEKEKEGVYA